MVRKTGADIRAAMNVEKEKKCCGYDKWEVDGWAETLSRAAEIISDPKKMKAVAKVLDQKKKSLKTLQALKDYANGKGLEQSEDLDDK